MEFRMSMVPVLVFAVESYSQHDRDTAKTRSRVCSSRLWHELFYVAAGADSRCRLRAHQLESTPVRLGHK